MLIRAGPAEPGWSGDSFVMKFYVVLEMSRLAPVSIGDEYFLGPRGLSDWFGWSFVFMNPGGVNLAVPGRFI